MVMMTGDPVLDAALAERARRQGQPAPAPQPTPAPQPMPRGGILAVPTPPQAQRESNVGIDNTVSQINSRGVQDALTGVQTQGAVLNNIQAQTEIENARNSAARREGVQQRAVSAVDAALGAISNARRANTLFSTGTVGNIIGRPSRGEGDPGAGLSTLPYVGGAIYGDTDRAELDTYLQTIQSGLTYDALQDIRERAAAAGGSSAGVSNTNMAEFQALGTSLVNLMDAQSAGTDVLTQQLDVAEEQLLRKRAALTVPIEQLVAATPEQRRALLDQAYEQTVRQYRGGTPPAGGGTPPAGGGTPPAGGRTPLPPFTNQPTDGSIATESTRLVPDPRLRGLNQQVAQMVRNGTPASEILDFLRSRNVNFSFDPAFVSAVQRNVEAFRPYVGRPLPRGMAGPVVNVENVREPVPLTQQILGMAADNPVGAGVINFAEGISLGGLDELAAATSGRSLEDQAAVARYLDQSYPIMSTTGRITGTVAAALPVGRGVNALTAAARLGPRAAALAAGGANVALGAVEGALDSNNDRKTGALIGAGAALLGDRIGNFVGGRLARLGNSAPTGAERAMADAITDPDTVRGILADAERVGSPVSLADTSPALRNLAGTSVRRSESAARLADSTIQPRDLAQVDRAVSAVERVLGSAETNVTEAARRIRTEGQNAADAIYKRAFSQAAPSTDTELASILQRPVLRDGLTEAQRTLANRGRDWRAMGFDLNDQGEVILRPGASFEALDQVKRGIDTVLRRPEYRDNFGRLDTRNPSVQAIVDAQQALVGRMRALNTDYAAALDTYAPFAQNAEALELGGRAISASRATPAEISQAVSQMSPEQLANYQIGAANEIIARAKTARDNTDAFGMFRSRDMRERLAAIFPDRANELADFSTVADLESAMRRTREALLGGSPTQGRAVADEAFNTNVAGGVFGPLAEGTAAVASGGVTSALSSLVRAGRLGFRDANRLADLRNQEALATDLAPILLETDPGKARRMLDDILQNVDSYNQAVARGRTTGRSTGAGVAAGILNTGQ